MPLVGIGTLPTPFSPASVPLPPETGGRGHTSLRVGGWGESQFRRGAYTLVLFICTYFVPNTQHYGPPLFTIGLFPLCVLWSYRINKFRFILVLRGKPMKTLIVNNAQNQQKSGNSPSKNPPTDLQSRYSHSSQSNEGVINVYILGFLWTIINCIFLRYEHHAYCTTGNE